MKVDITELLIIFDELLPLTKEEEGTYWFQSSCKGGVIATLVISIYESKCSVSIYNSSDSEDAIASLHFNNCSEIRTLDEKRKCLELVHDNGRGRCLLCLLDTTVLRYRE